MTTAHGRLVGPAFVMLSHIGAYVSFKNRVAVELTVLTAPVRPKILALGPQFGVWHLNTHKVCKRAHPCMPVNRHVQVILPCRTNEAMTCGPFEEGGVDKVHECT